MQAEFAGFAAASGSDRFPPGPAAATAPPNCVPNPLLGHPTADLSRTLGPSEPTLYGHCLARLSAPVVPAAVHDPVTSRQIYEEGLAAAAKVCDQALKPDTVQKQEVAGLELAAWLATQPHGRDLRTCTDSDLLVNVQTCWLPGRSVE
ncbi:hypothetical protein PLESTF_000959900 [Pleodorina starrii]|nr:hypothetical protein PLESTF_000959900 [Pleodorina starrii]